MKTATGIVVHVYDNYVCVRNIKGEFINLKLKNYTPNIGDIYTGIIHNSNSAGRTKGIILACIMLVIFLAQSVYFYFSPVATIIVDIPPTVQLKVNKWNKIIDIKTYKPSSRKLISPIEIKNSSINEGLQAIILEGKKQKVINDKHLVDNHPITIFISSEDNLDIDLVEFDNFMKHQELKYQVNNNGSGTLEK